MRAKILILCALGATLAGCGKPERQKDSAADGQQIVTALLAKWQKAFEAKDVNGVMVMYAPGDALTAYDIVPPLQYKGADAYRKDYSEFFSQFDGPLHVEFADGHMESSGNLTLAYGLERLSGKLKSGQPVDMWVRYDSVFKQIDGRWRDIHDHISVPADLNSGKAVLDLKP